MRARARTQACTFTHTCMAAHTKIVHARMHAHTHARTHKRTNATMSTHTRMHIHTHDTNEPTHSCTHAHRIHLPPRTCTYVPTHGTAAAAPTTQASTSERNPARVGPPQVRACMCVRACACVRACMRACVRACGVLHFALQLHTSGRSRSRTREVAVGGRDSAAARNRGGEPSKKASPGRCCRLCSWHGSVCASVRLCFHASMHAAESTMFSCSIISGHDSIGHDYIGHDFIGHDYIGHDYIGHNHIDTMLGYSILSAAALTAMLTAV